MINIKSDREIKIMREVCKLVAETHDVLSENIKPGVSAYDLDMMAEKFIKSKGGIPSQKDFPSEKEGIKNFPSTLCVSINDEIIHGIPTKNKIIKDGDIVSIDLTVFKNGFHGDAARSHLVGNVSKNAKELVEATKQAFFEGIKFAKPGFRIGDISFAINEYIRKYGYSVLKEFQGHGIGKEMHEDPGVPNYGKRDKGPRLEQGMVLAIEPMISAGKPDMVESEDGWTIKIKDGSLSAHYENTILITENEPEILTMI